MEEAGGNGQTVLEQFVGIIWINHRDGLGNGGSKSRFNLFEQERFYFAVHGMDLLRS